MADKASLRTFMLGKRKQIPLSEELVNVQALVGFLARVFGARDMTRDVVAFYAPVNGEIDLTTFAQTLSDKGVTLCLPRAWKAEEPLKFHAWRPGDVLTQRDIYDIPCADGDEVVPTVALVPLVAFDKHGYRVGYGGGYYDRTFAHLGDCFKIGIGYAFQEVGMIQPERYDIPMDVIVTEAGVMTCHKENS